MYATLLRYAAIAMTAALLRVSFAAAGSEPFHTKYVAITDSRSEQFVEEGLASAIEFLGEPAIPVKKVHLRQSTPIDPKSNLRSGFQLCELVDADKGIFAIYLGRKPAEYAYHGQLAHEIAHLVNARLYDCYVEGLNTVFAERFTKKKGFDWSGWDSYLRKGDDKFYGSTYVMMKDVNAAAGDAHIKKLLSFARWTNEEKTRMHIDINGWLDSLPMEVRTPTRAAILKHADAVRQANALNKNGNTFMMPK
jgi:hypothetical protein